jgi:hypothetical protein
VERVIQDAITWVLSNAGIVLFVVAIITSFAKVRRARTARQSPSVASIFWSEILFYAVGIGFVYYGLLHAYAQNIAAPSIGWLPSPFEYELGWVEIGLGVSAILSLWRGYDFRLALSIPFVIFSWAAAAQHIQLIICCHNMAPGNAGLILWFSDIAVPLIVLVLAILSSRSVEDPK